jgi:hypothetical protein
MRSFEKHAADAEIAQWTLRIFNGIALNGRCGCCGDSHGAESYVHVQLTASGSGASLSTRVQSISNGARCACRLLTKLGACAKVVSTLSMHAAHPEVARCAVTTLIALVSADGESAAQAAAVDDIIAHDGIAALLAVLDAQPANEDVHHKIMWLLRFVSFTRIDAIDSDAVVSSACSPGRPLLSCLCHIR